MKLEKSSTVLAQQQIQSRVIIAKSTKSIGISVFLVAIFEPLGMFYSTIGGGILMTILAPIIFVILLLTSNLGSLLLLAILYYPICMIWAASAANKYNQKIISQTQNS